MLPRFSFNSVAFQVLAGLWWWSCHITGTLAYLILRVSWLRIKSICPFWWITVSHFVQLASSVDIKRATKLHSANLMHNARLDRWTREWGDACERNIWYHLVICPGEIFDKQQCEGCFYAMFWMEPIAYTTQHSEKKFPTVPHGHQYKSSSENRQVVCEQNCGISP